jgi:serine/threonine protein kinase
MAKNRTTGRMRAVKLIPLDVPRTNLAGREIVSLTELEDRVGDHHPNLLAIHHVGKTDNYLFYVMDLADDVSGKSASFVLDYRPADLSRRLQFGPLEPDDCLRYARQLLEALAHLHKAGVVHRDVKPSNCLFVKGELKLADFGLLTATDSSLSSVGTPKYMPPDGQMNTRADVYAAGLVIYEMISGLPADRFPSLGGRYNDVSTDPTLIALNRLVLQACQTDPQKRFKDAKEMLAYLRDGRSSQRKSRSGLFVAAFLMLSVLIGTFAWVNWNSSPPQLPVSFISYPFEATIYLDGQVLLDDDGNQYTTPCTVPNLPGQVHHVVFKCDGLPDLDAGEIDFSSDREIIARWNSD